jgi:hypothetical protein
VTLLRQSGLGLATIVCAALAVGAVVVVAQTPPAGVVVSVDATAEIGTIPTRLGTEFVWPGVLDAASGTRDRFDALAPPLVRIDATTLGAASVLPAGRSKGSWSFTDLDSIVNDVRGGGGQVLLTIAYAPEWMWDCPSGGIRDPSFGEFGAYMARLVAYFNLGSFVAEDGRRIVNPAGLANRITYWELWNEPDQMNGCPPSGNHITPGQYVAMWNGTVPKMLAVDPRIKLVGPATSQAAATSGSDYVPAIMASPHPPDVISFHGYGGWLNSQTDRFLFDGQGSTFGLEGIERGVARVKAWAPETPVWITELNVDSAWDRDDPAARPWTGLGAAWGASAFRRLALAGVDAIFQYQFAHPDLRQFSLVDARSGTPLLSYWRDYYLARYFPPGSTLLESSSNLAGVESLAARVPGSNAVHVLVVNRQVDGDATVGGPGRPATVRVEVKDLGGTRSITVRTLDATTPLASGPAAATLATGDPVSLSLSGYAVAFIEFIERG